MKRSTGRCWGEYSHAPSADALPFITHRPVIAFRHARFHQRVKFRIGQALVACVLKSLRIAVRAGILARKAVSNHFRKSGLL